MSKKAMNTRGFTLLELAVVVAIIAVLATALLKRLPFYQEQAEKVAMEQMVGTLRSAMHIQTAALLAKGRTEDISHLLTQNPVDWLAEKPANYRGEYFAPKSQDIEPGGWYFDLKSRELIYMVRNNEHFRTEKGDLDRVHFRARLVNAIQGNGKTDDNMIDGVVLEPVIPYRWF